MTPLDCKLLYVLQVYEGDVDLAITVAQLLLRMHEQVAPVSCADCLVAYRWDCPRNRGLERTLTQVFPMVHVHRSRRKEFGWPGGPNGVWFDTMLAISELHERNEMNYACILTSEADAIPLVSTWDQRLLNAWNRTPKVCCAGCLVPEGHGIPEHINGNALFDARTMARLSGVYGSPAYIGWDVYLAKRLKDLGWRDIPEIRSRYRARNVSPNSLDELVKNGCVWLHGVKDGSALGWVKSSLEKG